METRIVRKRFTFTGRVQGVGFRYRAKYVASGLGLTGWVRNEWDGSVEMEVQGNEDAINKMLFQLNQGKYIVIDNMKITDITFVEDERGFHTR